MDKANKYKGLVYDSPLFKDSKYGYANENGSIVIPVIYDSAGHFHDSGYAEYRILNESDKYGMIDIVGNVMKLLHTIQSQSHQ